MTPETIRQNLLTFIGSAFLDPESRSSLSPDTPLLEWGVLDSLNIARLLAHIRGDLGIDVPARFISSRHFRTVDDITALLAAQAADATTV